MVHCKDSAGTIRPYSQQLGVNSLWKASLRVERDSLRGWASRAMKGAEVLVAILNLNGQSLFPVCALIDPV